jgi:hypothetical protein
MSHLVHVEAVLPIGEAVDIASDAHHYTVVLLDVRIVAGSCSVSRVHEANGVSDRERKGEGEGLRGKGEGKRREGGEGERGGERTVTPWRAANGLICWTSGIW